MNDAQIFAQVQKAGINDQYNRHLETLIGMLDDAQDKGDSELAGFLFAFAATANEVQRRRCKVKPR